MTEFKCMWNTEPVSDCPPVKELNRLRAEVKRLEEENAKLQERAWQASPLQEDGRRRAVGDAVHYKSNAGEVMTTI